MADWERRAGAALAAMVEQDGLRADAVGLVRPDGDAREAHRETERGQGAMAIAPGEYANEARRRAQVQLHSEQQQVRGEIRHWGDDE